MQTARQLTREQVMVFDLDDTLYLEADFVQSGFREVDEWVVETLGTDGFFVEAWALFKRGTRGNIFDLALKALGIAGDPDRVQAMVTVYREHRPRIELLPDARRILAARNLYAGFALVTDGYHLTQQRKIEALGVAAYCSPAIRTDVWGRAYWKPHARSFETIQAYYDRPATAFTYIGDNPMKDFTAPRALGWHTVRIRRPGGLHSAVEVKSGMDAADETIESLDELRR